MRTININSQAQADNLPSHVDANVIVEAPMTIKVAQLKSISGFLLIKSKFHAPQLAGIDGDLSVRSDLYVPLLTTIGGYLTVRSPFTAPALKSIGSYLSIQADCQTPVLNSIEGYLLVKHPYDAPELKCIGGYLMIENRFTSPLLTEIAGDLYVQAKYEAPMLQRIDGYLYVHAPFTAKSLSVIGDYLSVESEIAVPSIQSIEGDLFIEAECDLNLLKQKAKKRIKLRVKEGFEIEIDQHGDYLLMGESVDTIVSLLKLRHTSFQNFQERELRREWRFFECLGDLMERIDERWNVAKSFAIGDVFKIGDLTLRRLFFQYIPPGKIMQALNARRIVVDGKKMNYFKYVEGEKIPWTRTNIYEIYEADASKLDPELKGCIYAVKCWCNTTNKEAWLWIEEQYKNDPLAAIASTFRLHENVLKQVKSIKRQGDILLVELNQSVIPEGNDRPLTKEEYFGLLIAET